ncbi:hypothetical protein M422DRAFT_782381 [Sphaerobolus stellatus SS14]|uniref:Unplaced genomic scaffold SPHSTscaffold_108, whole genome shotgun sequence n=1 Tax=Sphaerobolus stellatus (strain SS14) TaxID=990650 RepID=A0A0C9VEY9_SPHS4|nr:hypothetical protein M422DRAFT_782381 [Sphaerobolus stellatus SS14]
MTPRKPQYTLVSENDGLPNSSNHPSEYPWTHILAEYPMLGIQSKNFKEFKVSKYPLRYCPSSRERDEIAAQYEDQKRIILYMESLVTGIPSSWLPAYSRLTTSVLHGADLMSPIRKLPVEILSSIFVLVVPALIDHDGELQFQDGGATPEIERQSLSNVCRLWRFALKSTRGAWSTIVLDISHEQPSNLTTMFEESLAHTGQAPIQLCIKLVTGWRHQKTVMAISKLIKIIGPCVKRLTHLKLHVKHDLSASPQFQDVVDLLSLNGPLPSLKALDVGHFRGHWLQKVDAKWDFPGLNFLTWRIWESETIFSLLSPETFNSLGSLSSPLEDTLFYF